MKLKSNQPKATAEQVVKDIRRATRRHYSAEDKILIVLSGLRGEDSILVGSLTALGYQHSRICCIGTRRRGRDWCGA